MARERVTRRSPDSRCRELFFQQLLLMELGVQTVVADQLVVPAASTGSWNAARRRVEANTLLLHGLDQDFTIVILANTNLTGIDAFSFLIARTLAH